MEKNYWKKYSIWYTALSSALILVLCIILFKSYNSAPECVYVTDTIVIRKDSIIEKIKWKTEYDTIIDLQYKDTVIHDTVRIPIEHKVSEFTVEKDSLKITEKIHHSGWHSSIDSVELDYSFNYELKPTKKKKFGWCVTFGPSINYSVTLDTQNKTWSNGPSVGVSIVVGPSYIIK